MAARVMHAGPEAVDAARGTLESGGVIAYPTETFYALGARHDSEAACRRIYELKQRPDEKALPLIVGGEMQLRELVSGISEPARKLMARFWPGPLTLILTAREGLGVYVTYAGTVAVRMPGESFALSLARACGFAITATSANTAGGASASTADEAIAYFPEGIDLVVDGGRTPGGMPSTILDARAGVLRVLRQGPVVVDSLDMGGAS